MLKKLFGKKNKDLKIYTPITGELKALSEVPDQVFAEKMMGDGIAIIPSTDQVVSPVDGEVVQIFPTKHALGIRANNGVEVLIHVGIDTVQLKGEGFTAHVQEGEKVKVGDLLLEVDFKQVREQGKEIITPMIITNGDMVQALEKKEIGQVTRGIDTVMTVTIK